MRQIKAYDMPKIECPFIRKAIAGRYLITPEINPGYEWVFTDDSVKAIEKLHGTNVSIIIIEGAVVEAYNRTERVPFINKGKAYITQGLLNARERGYIEFLSDGQHFGELVGPKVNGNPYNLKEPLWIPFETYAQKHLTYKSWGKYPKSFEAIYNWFKDDLLSLFYAINNDGDRNGFVEGVVFTKPTGEMAKIRKDMFDFYTGSQHKSKQHT